MTFVVSFKGLRPSPRSDATKWTNSTIEQADIVAATGEPVLPFTAVESFAIADYPDPTAPPTLERTTDLATLLPGWYRVRFNDAGSGVEYTAPRLFSATSFRPSTKTVAAYIDNRTVDGDNNFLHDFTTVTIVHVDTVEELISIAEQRILGKLDVDPNVPIPTEDSQVISGLVALYAAMLVELTKFSEQIQTNRSPYPHLLELFNQQMIEALENIRGVPPGSSGGGSLSLWDIVATQHGEASYSFPTDPMVNWNTAF